VRERERERERDMGVGGYIQREVDQIRRKGRNL
jgi:hypothetical protein